MGQSRGIEIREGLERESEGQRLGGRRGEKLRLKEMGSEVEREVERENRRRESGEGDSGSRRRLREREGEGDRG